MIRNTSNDKNSSTSILQKVMTLALVAMFMAFVPMGVAAQDNTTTSDSGVGLDKDKACENTAPLFDVLFGLGQLFVGIAGFGLTFIYGPMAYYANGTTKKQDYIKRRNGGIAGLVAFALIRLLGPTLLNSLGFGACLDYMTSLAIATPL